MIRKKCALCGKWVIKINQVLSSHGDVYCSECYHRNKYKIQCPEVYREPELIK